MQEIQSVQVAVSRTIEGNRTFSEKAWYDFENAISDGVRNAMMKAIQKGMTPKNCKIEAIVTVDDEEVTS